MNTVIVNRPADIKTENEVTFLGKANDCFFDESVSADVIARFQAVQTGDKVEFGYYAQDSDKKAAELPIEWIVLDKQGSRMLLVSRYILDAGAYNFIIPDNSDDEDNDILKEPIGRWDVSSLRRWLNRTFYDSDFTKTAFSDAEKMIHRLEKIRKTARHKRNHDKNIVVKTKMWVANSWEGC